MMMPSKKLLSAVLNHDNSVIGEYTYISKHKQMLHIGIELDGLKKEKQINIHELQSKMKKWALENGYWIDSNLGFVSVGGNGSRTVCKTFNGYDLKMSESGLVTEACEWIMKESR